MFYVVRGLASVLLSRTNEAIDAIKKLENIQNPDAMDSKQRNKNININKRKT